MSEPDLRQKLEEVAEILEAFLSDDYKKYDDDIDVMLWLDVGDATRLRELLEPFSERRR